MRNHLQLLVVAVLVQVNFVATLQAEIRFTPSINGVIRGGWLASGTGPVELFGDTLAWDIDQNSRHDVTLSHGYIFDVQPVTPEMTPRIESALAALREVKTLLTDARDLAAISANTGVNDIQVLHDNQAELDLIVETIHRIAHVPFFDRRPMLDGSSGLTANIISGPAVAVQVRAPAVVGTHDYQLVTYPEVPELLALVPQQMPLQQEETITINNVSIELSAGLTQDHVINRINEFSTYTGVFARRDATTGQLSILSGTGGEQVELGVVSSVPEGPNTTGFGNIYRIDSGADAVVRINAEPFRGNGANVSWGSDSELGGVILTVPYANGHNNANNDNSTLGQFIVVDNSVSFTYPSGAIGHVTFPDIRPQGLGRNIAGNMFANLSEARVLSASQAQDSIGVIEIAEQQIDRDIDYLEEVRVGVPVSHAAITGSAAVRFLGDSDRASLVPAGGRIGPGDSFHAASIILEPNSMGYLGVELTGDDGVHYGWLNLATDHDRGIVLRDAAFETIPGRAIVIGLVPEASGLWSGGIALTMLVWIATKRDIC